MPNKGKSRAMKVAESAFAPMICYMRYQSSGRSEFCDNDFGSP